MFTTNPLLNVDSYKKSHFLQYPPGTEYVSSYIESRGGDFDRTIMSGFTYFAKTFLATPVTHEHVKEAKEVCKLHGVPFNEEGYTRLVEVHGGYWPVQIKAVPEGTVVEGKNVLLQITNTDALMPWVTSFLETALLRAIWYPTTVATLSWHIRQDIMKALEKTAEKPMEVIDFMLNDFGSRGVSSLESSALGGMAHLINFKGTDNLPAIEMIRNYYGCTMAGNSIPAAEHSTITTWPREVDAFDNMITQFASGGILAVVSDSYDIYNACDKLWGVELYEKVKNCGARVVIRPDSGNAETVPVECVKILAKRFGFTMNDKGFKVLPWYIRVIQGDGVNRASINKIMLNLILEGFSVENVCFGMGGALLQILNRDTLKFAMKCSAIRINGVWADVYKDPITDPGKTSKKGILGLFIDSKGKYITDRIENGYLYKVSQDQMKVMYENGQMFNLIDFDDIRRNAAYRTLQD